MNRQERRATAAQLHKDNAKQSENLVSVSSSEWPFAERDLIALWRSKRFLVQVYDEGDAIYRLSVCRTAINDQGEWKDNITWEELQEIKKTCGYGDLDAVEIYPREKDVVNVANMRHLWVLPQCVLFAWRNGITNA